jgi:hypothetical protein
VTVVSLWGLFGCHFDDVLGAFEPIVMHGSHDFELGFTVIWLRFWPFVIAMTKRNGVQYIRTPYSLSYIATELAMLAEHFPSCV